MQFLTYIYESALLDAFMEVSAMCFCAKSYSVACACKWTPLGGSKDIYIYACVSYQSSESKTERHPQLCNCSQFYNISIATICKQC